MYAAPTITMDYNYWLIPVITRRKLTALDIIKAGSKVFNLSIERLQSKSRQSDIVRARNICMYIMKKKLLLSLCTIGKTFNRDHTTVIHALKCVDIELSMAHTRQQMNEDLKKVMEVI